MQHPASCDMLSCLQKWLCMTLHHKRKWKQEFKIQVLSKGAVYVRYLDSHPSHRAIWFMFPTLWPQAEYHVLMWFEGFFGLDEPRWDCWVDRLSLWDQDCRQEGQNSLRDVFFFCGSKSNALVVNCWISRQNIQNDGWQSKCLQDPWAITVSPKHKTSDLQKRTQHGQQPADSDAEAVVQYLSKRLIKRKTCAGTDGKDLFRPLLTIKKKRIHRSIVLSSSSIFRVFSNGCEGGPGQHALSVIFFNGNPSLPPSSRGCCGWHVHAARGAMFWNFSLVGLLSAHEFLDNYMIPVACNLQLLGFTPWPQCFLVHISWIESSIGCSIYQHSTWWVQRLMPDTPWLGAWCSGSSQRFSSFFLLLSCVSRSRARLDSRAPRLRFRGLLGGHWSGHFNNSWHGELQQASSRCVALPHSVCFGVFASLCREIYRKVARWPSAEVATRNSNSQNW